MLSGRRPIPVLACALLTAQQFPAQQFPEQQFEAASVKPAPQGAMFSQRFSPDRFDAVMTLKILIGGAWSPRPGSGEKEAFDITGGPAWINTDMYAVSAKAPREANREEMKAMLRTLLEERFHLEVRRTVKDGPVYFLSRVREDAAIVDNDHLRSAAAACGANCRRQQVPAGPDLELQLQDLSFAGFASSLGALVLHRPVIDRSGITGNYDFVLRFARTDAPDAGAATAPSIFAALREQMGLKLEAGRGEIPILVIDRVERPSGN